MERGEAYEKQDQRQPSSKCDALSKRTNPNRVQTALVRPSPQDEEAAFGAEPVGTFERKTQSPMTWRVPSLTDPARRASRSLLNRLNATQDTFA